MTDPVLRLDRIGVSFPSPQGAVTALDAVDLELWPGSTTSIVGRSGSGKSTLLSVLALLRRPTSGDVYVGGRDVSGLSDGEVSALRGSTLATIFQSFHLDVGATARENVILPWYLGVGSGSRRSAYQRASDLLERMGLSGLDRRRCSQMSGGQRQRVAIARALFGDPQVVLADEPTGSLDEDTAAAIASDLYGLSATGTAIVVVTHDRVIAGGAQRQLELQRGAFVP